MTISTKEKSLKRHERIPRAYCLTHTIKSKTMVGNQMSIVSSSRTIAFFKSGLFSGPGLKAGIPKYGQLAHLNASPK